MDTTLLATIIGGAIGAAAGTVGTLLTAHATRQAAADAAGATKRAAADVAAATKQAAVEAADLQANASLNAQFQSWRQEARTAVYGGVVGTFRELMTAWWTLSAGRRQDTIAKDAMRQRVLTAHANFNSELGRAQLLTGGVLLDSINNLSTTVQDFDRLAEGMGFVHRQRWSMADDENYDRAREAAETAAKDFVVRAREQLAEQPRR